MDDGIMLYSGRDVIGRLVDVGPKAVDAFLADGTPLGRFQTRRAAQEAIYAKPAPAPLPKPLRASDAPPDPTWPAARSARP